VSVCRNTQAPYGIPPTSCRYHLPMTGRQTDALHLLLLLRKFILLRFLKHTDVHQYITAFTLNCPLKSKKRPFQATLAHWAALISVFVALSQTSAYTARPWIRNSAPIERRVVSLISSRSGFSFYRPRRVGRLLDGCNERYQHSFSLY